jgi:hypothetical protein
MIGCILISLGLTVGVGSGKPSPEPTPTATPPLAVTIGAVAPVRIFVGHETTITIPVRVADGHRVQANPASNEFLVPLQLEFEEVDGLVFGPAVYPKSEPYLLHGSEEVLETYVGELEVEMWVSATEGAAPGEYRASGELRFQACNSRMCLFPSSVPVELSLVVTAP